MTPETLKRLEHLNDEWANNGLAITQAEEVMDHLPDLIVAVKERDQLAEVIKDPAAVWTNMLRGTIARPVALEHYEECKAELEEAQKACAEMREAIELWNHPYLQATGADIETLKEHINRRITATNHALSTDCGKGWHSPEDYAALEKKCADLQLTFDGLNVGYIHERDVEPLIPYLRHGDKCTPGQTETDVDKCQCGLMTILAGLGFSKDGFKLDNFVQTVALSNPGRKEIKGPPANSTAAEHATGRTDASPNEPVTQSPAGEPAVKHPVGCGLTFTAEQVGPLAEALVKIEAKCNEPKDPDKVADIWEITKQALAQWEEGK